MDEDKKTINLKMLKTVRLWGASTSAHQVEGKNHNQWSVWELENANELARTAEDRLGGWLPIWEEIESEATQPDNYVSSVATDFYNRYEEDFDTLQSLNLNSFRFSIEWSRIEPEEGQWDYAQIEHYRLMIRSLRRRGVEPLPCMLHYTLPIWFFEAGGFTKRKNTAYFTRFCEKVMSELKDDLEYVYTMNEPNVDVGEVYFGGNRPGEKSVSNGIKAYFNMMKAHRDAYTVMKRIKRDLKVGMTQHLTHMFPASKNPISKIVVKFRSWIWNWLFFNRTKPYHDFIGINFYMSERIKLWKVDNQDEKRNDLGWDMHPYHLRYVLKQAYWKYKKPILISENGVADLKDQYRKWWIFQSLRAISDGLEHDQIEVIGYLHWSLLDNFEWNSGFWPRFGLVDVDRATLKRTVRDSAKWYGDVVKKLRS